MEKISIINRLKRRAIRRLKEKKLLEGAFHEGELADLLKNIRTFYKSFLDMESKIYPQIGGFTKDMLAVSAGDILGTIGVLELLLSEDTEYSQPSWKFDGQ